MIIERGARPDALPKPKRGGTALIAVVLGLAYSSVLVLACGCWHWQYSMPLARVTVSLIAVSAWPNSVPRYFGRFLSRAEAEKTDCRNESFEHGSTLLGKWEVIIIARQACARLSEKAPHRTPHV